MFSKMTEEYVYQQRRRIEKCSSLYATYTSRYHEFLIVRDLHVRLAGSSYNIHETCDFAVDELRRYDASMVAAREYLQHTIVSYDIEFVVPCRGIDVYSMTRERIRDEFLSPIHPDLHNFVCCIVHSGKMGDPDVIECKFYPDVFSTFSESRVCSNRMKELFFRYYGRYAVRPTASNRVYIPSLFKDIGVLEGELIYSEAEHAGMIRSKLDVLPLDANLQHIVLRFLFSRIQRTFSNSK